MTTLGIIGAMQVEVDLLLKAMDRKYGKTIAGSVFYEGTLEGIPVVAVHCSLWVASAMVRSLHLLESLILCIVEDALHCCCHLLALGLLLLHTGYILLGLLEAEFIDLIILILTQ